MHHASTFCVIENQSGSWIMGSSISQFMFFSYGFQRWKWSEINIFFNKSNFSNTTFNNQSGCILHLPPKIKHTSTVCPSVCPSTNTIFFFKCLHIITLYNYSSQSWCSLFLVQYNNSIIAIFFILHTYNLIWHQVKCQRLAL